MSELANEAWGSGGDACCNLFKRATELGYKPNNDDCLVDWTLPPRWSAVKGHYYEIR